MLKKGKSLINSVGTHLKNVSDTVNLKNVSDTIQQSTDKLKNLLQFKRLAVIKAVNEEMQRSVEQHNQQTKLYQLLISRAIEENQRLVSLVNDVLIKNYYEQNNFLCIPSDNTIQPVTCPLLQYGDAPEALTEKSLSVAAVCGGAAAGTAAYSGALGLMTLLGTASTGTAISGLSGAAYWSALLAAFGGGSLASGGLGIAGGTVVLGGLVALPALAGGYLFADRYTEKAYNKAINLKKDIVRFGRNAAAYYEKCEQQLDILQKINAGLSAISSFFSSMLGMSFAADYMPGREDYVAVYQRSAHTLIAYAKLSPVTPEGSLNTDIAADLKRADKLFTETQEAYFSLRAKVSAPYRDLLDKLADQSALFLSREKESDAAINDLKQALAEGRRSAEEQIKRLMREKNTLQAAANRGEEYREKLASLTAEQQAIQSRYIFRENQLNRQIREQEQALRRSEASLREIKTELKNIQDDAEYFQELYNRLEQEQRDSRLSEREAFPRLCSELKLQYGNFADKAIHSLATGEYLLERNKEQRLDFSCIAVYYGVALEGLMRELIHWRGISLPPGTTLDRFTLGSYCHFEKELAKHFEHGFFPILRRMTVIRNNAAHDTANMPSSEIEEAHRLLFETASIPGYKGLLDYLNHLLQ